MIFPEWLNVVGDTSYRGDCPKEDAELSTFISIIRRDHPYVPAMHIKNEGKRTAIQAAIDKAKGMRTGAADIVIPGSPSFVCEIKRLDHTKSKWQPDQQEFLYHCMLTGSYVCVALGWKAAYNAFIQYLTSYYGNDKTGSN